MPDSRPSLEIIAPTVDEAVVRGAAELGVSPQRLLVEVLDEGGQGVLGMGARQARVRLTLLGAPVPAKPTPEPEEDEEEELGPTDPALDVSRETVRELVSLMGLQARVTSRWGEADSRDDTRPLLVDVRGDDLSLLIDRPRTMTREPMPPAERRIIHLELRDHPRVYTESVGEGEQRKVTVIPRGVEDSRRL